MAKEIIFSVEQNRRFTSFLEEYVSIPKDYYSADGQMGNISGVMAFLVENGVFTFAEIREECRVRKISIHEQYFQRANFLVERKYREREYGGA